MIILASSSPRRHDLLLMAGIAHECVPSKAEETVPEDTPVEMTAELLSESKAASVFFSYPSDTVIGSDTVVVIDGEILGKPKTKDEAFHMLKKLSGRVHRVYTGVTILSPDGRIRFTSDTEVEFYPLTDTDIMTYIETGEPMDKAGAYGIQGRGCAFVKRINGDYYTVMGLPVAETVRALRKLQSDSAGS